MSRKKIKGVMLLASALCFGIFTSTLVSCDNNNADDVTPTPTEDVDPVESSISGITINNKEDLASEWWVGDSDRSLDLTITGGDTQNLLTLINKKYIVVSSSDTSVAYVSGTKIHAVAEGTATITVKSSKASDTVMVTVKEVKEANGAEISLSTWISYPNLTTKYFKSKGVIKSWTKGSDGQVYGNFTLSVDWAKNGETIVVYGATGTADNEDGGSYTNSSGDPVEVKDVFTQNEETGECTFNNPRNWLTHEATKDLKIGDEIEFYGFRCDYNGTKEINIWGVKYLQHKDFEATAEPDPVAVTSMSQVAEGDLADVTKKKFTGTGYLTKVSSTKYGNLIIADSMDEGAASIPTYGATATAGKIVWDGVSEKYTYSDPYDWNTNEVTKGLMVGTKVDFEAIRTDYTKNGTTTKQVFAYIKKVYEVKPTALTLPATETVETGSSKTLEVGYGEGVTSITVPLTWTSSDETVATVANGVVTGVKAGTATITVTYGDLTATCTVTVADPVTPDWTEVSSVSEMFTSALSSEDGKVKYKGSAYITGWKTGSDGTSFGNFYINDTAAATGTDYCVYGATATESALSKAESDDEATFSFKNPQDWLINDDTRGITLGTKISFYAIRSDYASGSTKQLKMIVTDYEKNAPTSLTISGDSEVEVGSNISLSVAYGANDTNVNVPLTWESSDTEVATVDNTGRVRGLKEGTTNITVKYGEVVSVAYAVTVKAAAAVNYVACYEFGNNTSTSELKTADAVKSHFNDNCTGTDILTGVTTVTKVYAGQSNYTSLGLKFGTKSNAGKLVFTVKGAFTKVKLNYIGWTNSDTINVNSLSAQTSTKAYSAVTADTMDEYTWNVTGTADTETTITIDVNMRGYIKTITFLA